MKFLLILLVSFLVGLEGILDEWQFHQPIISCTLLGLVTNQLELGVSIGGLLQLACLGWVNVGAAVAPDAALAGVICFIICYKTYAYNIGLSMLIAIVLSGFGTFLTGVCRKLAINLVHNMEKELSIMVVTKWHLIALAMQGARVMLVALILMIIPSSVYLTIFSILPDWLYYGLAIGISIVPTVGFAMVYNVIKNKEIIPFFLLGLGLGAIEELSLFTLFIIALALAIIYVTMTKNKSVVQEDELTKIIEDY